MLKNEENKQNKKSSNDVIDNKSDIIVITVSNSKLAEIIRNKILLELKPRRCVYIMADKVNKRWNISIANEFGNRINNELFNETKNFVDNIIKSLSSSSTFVKTSVDKTVDIHKIVDIS